MAFNRETVLEQYPTIVTDILKATKENPEDEEARARVALSLVRSLTGLGRRSDKDVTPQDTELFKLAKVVGKARSTEEFETLLKEALPKAGKDILTKYKLPWNLPVEKKRRARTTVQKAAAPQDASDIVARIEKVELSLTRIEQQLAVLDAKGIVEKLTEQIDEIRQKLRLHQHDREDGRAYIMEKKEL